jgi:hypothetical protein
MSTENMLQDSNTFDSSIAPSVIASFSAVLSQHLTPSLRAVKSFAAEAIQRHTAAAVVGAMLAMAGGVAHADSYSGAALGNLVNGIRDMATNAAPLPYNVDQMGRDSTAVVTTLVPSKNQSGVAAIGAILSHSAARSLYENSAQGKAATASRQSSGSYSQGSGYNTQPVYSDSRSGSSGTRYNGPSNDNGGNSNVSYSQAQSSQASQQDPIFQKMKPLVDREISEGVDARLAGRDDLAGAHFQKAINILYAGKRMNVFYPAAVEELSRMGIPLTEAVTKTAGLAPR